jgi:hypothetical protein
MSKPLQVYIDEADLERLESWASERGWTKSDAIRAAIRALLRSTEGRADALLDLSGMIQAGLPEDASERFDALLDGTFVAESAPRYRRRPAGSRGRGTKKSRGRPRG